MTKKERIVMNDLDKMLSNGGTILCHFEDTEVDMVPSTYFIRTQNDEHYVHVPSNIARTLIKQNFLVPTQCHTDIVEYGIFG